MSERIGQSLHKISTNLRRFEWNHAQIPDNLYYHYPTFPPQEPLNMDSSIATVEAHSIYKRAQDAKEHPSFRIGSFWQPFEEYSLALTALECGTANYEEASQLFSTAYQSHSPEDLLDVYSWWLKTNKNFAKKALIDGKHEEYLAIKGDGYLIENKIREGLKNTKDPFSRALQTAFYVEQATPEDQKRLIDNEIKNLLKVLPKNDFDSKNAEKLVSFIDVASQIGFGSEVQSIANYLTKIIENCDPAKTNPYETATLVRFLKNEAVTNSLRSRFIKKIEATLDNTSASDSKRFSNKLESVLTIYNLEKGNFKMAYKHFNKIDNGVDLNFLVSEFTVYEMLHREEPTVNKQFEIKFIPILHKEHGINPGDEEGKSWITEVIQDERHIWMLNTMFGAQRLAQKHNIFIFDRPEIIDYLKSGHSDSVLLDNYAEIAVKYPEKTEFLKIVKDRIQEAFESYDPSNHDKRDIRTALDAFITLKKNGFI